MTTGCVHYAYGSTVGDCYHANKEERECSDYTNETTYKMMLNVPESYRTYNPSLTGTPTSGTS